jgi:hypothetical protein
MGGSLTVVALATRIVGTVAFDDRAEHPRVGISGRLDFAE